MKFSFVIPAHNNWQLCHQLLFDIYKNCSAPYEVVVMNDASTEESFLLGIEWWKNTGLLPIKHCVNKENVGFLKNSNIGLKLADGDTVCLVSTDVRIQEDIVGYWTSHNSLIGGRLLDWDTGWNAFRGKIYPYLEGWILTTTKDNWKNLEYFDEQYAPHDFEDVDLSTKALEMSLSLEVYPDGYVSHIGAQTIGYNIEREAITRRNKERFKRKWIK